MSAALQEPRALPTGAASSEAPAAASGRLLAVRRAGAPFDGASRLRSPRFARLAREWDSASARLAELRGSLVEELYRAVPRAGDRHRRRSLLRLKRDVHNLRPLPDLPRGLPPALRRGLRRYSELLHRRDTVLANARREVVGETRRRIREALREPRFRLACRYSSPDLWRAIEKAEPAPEDAFTPAERGIYAYAAKLVAKANPFHLFSEIGFPPETGIVPEGEVEVVFDTDLAFDLERRLLPEARDSRRVWMASRPVWIDGPSHRFWAASSRGSRVVSVRTDDRLRFVLGFFAARQRASGRPTGTRAHWRTHLRGSLPRGEQEEVDRYLRRLVDHGAVAEYLVTDLREFPAQLQDLSARWEPLLRVLRAWHLAPRTVAELEGLDRDLAAVDGGPGRAGEVRYFVNAYGAFDHQAPRTAAATVSPHLTDLKPLFGVEHNFSRTDPILRAFLRDFVEGRPGGSAPYLEALRHFLRHRDDVVARFQPEAHHPAEERRALARWWKDLPRERGTLTRQRVLELATRARRLGPTRELCFNGPFDYVQGLFYVSNVFAGGGRFASRYVLRRRRVETAPAPASESKVVDVELAVPPRPNLNFVVGAHPVGCGFDARFAHRYRRWIDPAQVEVTLRNGDVVYRQTGSGRRLRFHYRGFLLAHLLPPEYQLLLVGHADAFSNPFLGRLAPRLDTADDGVRHVPALVYGPVCLRRERWDAALTTVRPLLRDGDALRATLRLRDWVRAGMRPVEDWYYRLLTGPTERRPPRYLDLRNPLSVHALRRDLTDLPDDAAVSLSPMAPPPEHLFQEAGSRYVTELMVEV